MGRPKSDEARQAAIAATVELLLDKGIDAITFEDVATRSGVAKSTLYRHFGSKHSMVAAAAATCFVVAATPDTGDLRTDLLAIFEQSKAAEEERRIPDVMPELVAASQRDPELHTLLLAIFEEKRRPIRTVLQLAQLRGEISRDLDLDLAMALLLGPFVQRRMIDHLDVTPEFRAAVVEHFVAGVHAGVSVPA